MTFKGTHWSKMPNAEDIKKQISSTLKNNIPWNKGKKGWFPHEKRPFVKGHIPWNKGLHVQTNTGKSHFKKGQKPALWKGGISSLQSRIYSSPQNKLWREEIFRRDKWICQTCGFKGDLEAHHIIPMNQILKRVMIEGVSKDDKFLLAMSIPELFDINNGITLCKDCHYSKHKRRIK